MKKIWFIFPLFFVFASCCKNDACKKRAQDFETLMGKDLPNWKYVQTEEDFENLKFFKSIYEKNISFLQSDQTEARIPQVVHIIWLGPKPFPRKSIENLRTWIAKNPKWKVKFWTDRNRPLPHPLVEKVLLKNFKFLKLERFFNESDNYGEKSDLLRYEILYQEGGVYVDHDVKCLQSFDSLNASYDLYCGLEVPYPTGLSSCMLPTNNLLGAKKGHFLLEKCMDWLEENWDEIQQNYPGKDRESIIERVSHRTFFVLGESFKKFANKKNDRDMVFPSFYFNSPKEEMAIYAQHQYAGTWFENESAFEKMVRERLMMLSKKTNKLLLGLGVFAGCNFIGFILMFIFFKKARAT